MLQFSKTILLDSEGEVKRFERTNSNTKANGGHVMLKKLEGQTRVLAIS